MNPTSWFVSATGVLPKKDNPGSIGAWSKSGNAAEDSREMALAAEPAAQRDADDALLGVSHQ